MSLYGREIFERTLTYNDDTIINKSTWWLLAARHSLDQATANLTLTVERMHEIDHRRKLIATELLKRDIGEPGRV